MTEPLLILHSDASPTQLRYCIYGPSLGPIWFGPFRRRDRRMMNEYGVHLASAYKAIFLARCVMRVFHYESLRVRLGVSDPALLDRSGPKARKLNRKAGNYGLKLEVGLSPDGLDQMAYEPKAPIQFSFMIEEFASLLEQSALEVAI